MSRKLAIGAIVFTLASCFAAPAAAFPAQEVQLTSERLVIRPVPPGSPRGLDRSGVERPEQAETPTTGPINRSHNPNF